MHNSQSFSKTTTTPVICSCNQIRSKKMFIQCQARRLRTLLLSACVLVILASVAQHHTADACGPGRVGLRRRMLRKYTPLVQRQYIPNVQETMFGASGRPEGKIRRQDRRFRELVQNRNPDIEFRDDERTGADRMMSRRLKEKLSTLAISVMNQWPNVKLRVIEGWDEDDSHSSKSLHYEGRAVDITTSDRDQKKIGMLARLAVEAGFDWVHYESKSHVHCSVKSERGDMIKNNGCFDAAGVVETPFGPMRISELQTNDLVLTMNPRDGQLDFSPVIMWLDRDAYGEELYVELRTKSQRLIRLTSSHLIYVADEPFDSTASSQQLVSIMEQQQQQLKSNKSLNSYYYELTGNETATADLESTQQQQQQRRKSLPFTIPLSFEDLAYTQYARSAMVGQYLLTSLPEDIAALQRESRSDSQSTRTERWSKLATGAFTAANRLVFEPKQSLDNQIERDASSAKHNKRDKRAVAQQHVITFDQIVSVNFVTRRGIYAPLTREGNIVVNSVVASCYAVINDQELAHLSFAPVRWLSYFTEWLMGPPTPATSTRSRTIVAMQQDYTHNSTSRNPNKQRAAEGVTQVETLESRADSAEFGTHRIIHWYPLMLYKLGKFLLPTRYLF